MKAPHSFFRLIRFRSLLKKFFFFLFFPVHHFLYFDRVFFRNRILLNEFHGNGDFSLNIPFFLPEALA